MTADEARSIAKEAAREAVADMFLHLGYDVQDKDQVRNLKSDLLHLRRWRKATDHIGTGGAMAIAAVVVSGAAGLVWAGVQALLSRGGQ